MLKNKVAIVTGASQGLGKELSLQLANHGAKVALLARTEKDLKKVKAEITDRNGIAEYFVCDVTDQRLVQNTIQKVLDNFGSIDILINNAGIWTTDELEEKRPELIEKAFRVNAIAPIYMTKALLPHFKEKNSGHILNVISVAGTDRTDNKDWPTYTATKWAITGYTKSLKYALVDSNIKISAFYPAGFESNIFETAGEFDAHNQPWMMRTNEVAQAIINMLNTPKDLYYHSLEISN